MYSPLSLFCFTSFSHIWGICYPHSHVATPPEKVARKRIAIVGGGTAGLAALKTFVHDIPKSLGEEWDITLYEQRQKLGGVWFVRVSGLERRMLMYLQAGRL